jgi:hypothetical protein
VLIDIWLFLVFLSSHGDKAVWCWVLGFIHGNWGTSGRYVRAIGIASGGVLYITTMAFPGGYESPGSPDLFLRCCSPCIIRYLFYVAFIFDAVMVPNAIVGESRATTSLFIDVTASKRRQNLCCYKRAYAANEHGSVFYIWSLA